MRTIGSITVVDFLHFGIRAKESTEDTDNVCLGVLYADVAAYVLRRGYVGEPRALLLVEDETYVFEAG